MGAGWCVGARATAHRCGCPSARNWNHFAMALQHSVRSHPLCDLWVTIVFLSQVLRPMAVFPAAEFQLLLLAVGSKQALRPQLLCGEGCTGGLLHSEPRQA